MDNVIDIRGTEEAIRGYSSWNSGRVGRSKQNLMRYRYLAFPIGEWHLWRHGRDS